MTRLTELLEAATPGPWFASYNGDHWSDKNEHVICANPDKRLGGSREIAQFWTTHTGKQTAANVELAVFLVNRAREIERVVEAAKEVAKSAHDEWCVCSTCRLRAALAELEAK